MSRAVPVEVSCPGCGRTKEQSVWASVNVTVDPYLKDELLGGRLNVFRCPCGREAELSHDLLYHDMDLGFQIWLKHPNDGGHITLDGTALGVAKGLMRDYRFRVVRARNELKEKIVIFDDGLDDRVIEVIKLSIIQASPTDGEVRYVDLEPQTNGESMLGFVLFRGTGDATPFDVSFGEGYRGLRNRMESAWPEQMEEGTGWRIIGQAFAQKMALRLNAHPQRGSDVPSATQVEQVEVTDREVVPFGRTPRGQERLAGIVIVLCGLGAGWFAGSWGQLAGLAALVGVALNLWILVFLVVQMRRFGKLIMVAFGAIFAGLYDGAKIFALGALVRVVRLIFGS